ncbi:MAG: hypothetical protein ACE5EE_08600 [Fidelibacterota bacterium]
MFLPSPNKVMQKDEENDLIQAAFLGITHFRKPTLSLSGEG